jgi:hypothetical protein
MKCPVCNSEVERWGYLRKLVCPGCSSCFEAPAYWKEVFIVLIIGWGLSVPVIYISLFVVDSMLLQLVGEVAVLCFILLYLLPSWVKYEKC